MSSKLEQFKAELEKFESEEEAKKHIAEIAERLGVSKSLGYKALRRIGKFWTEKKKIEVEAKEPTLEIEEKEEAPEIEEEIEEVAEEKEAMPEILPRLEAIAREEWLTEEDLTNLFKIANENLRSFLGEQYAPKDSTASLLAKLGLKPLNRLANKYLDENIDLYIFAVACIGVYAPPLMKYAKERKAEKEKK